MTLIKKFVIYLSFVTILIIMPLLMLIWHHQKELLFRQAEIQAETLFKMIVITRQWVAENRDRIEPVPAVATKELSQYADKMANFKFRITSDILVNPENAPDPFEKVALKKFKEGIKEYSEIIEVKGVGSVFRYMAPLHINESCLKCHYYQGYKIGDIRGGISVFIPLKNVQEAIIANNKMFYIFGFITLTSIIITVTILVNNLVLRHIKVLNNASNAVIANDYSVRTNIKTGDEIEHLSVAFDKMVETISQNEEILKKRLNDAISKYVLLYEELKEKNEKLQSVNNLKTDIIDTMAHDLRTPMTKILAYSEMLRDPKFNTKPEAMNRAIDVIYNSINLLKRSLDQILILSKLEHTEFNLNMTKINLHDKIIEILSLYEKEIEDKGLKIEVNINKNINLNTDEDIFYHIVKNIISNAVKYNKPSGEIIINSFSNPNELILEFYDSGIGIKKDELDKIYKRFFRGSNVRSSHSGTGLGMSIVLKSVEKLGWQVLVESEEDIYTKFSLYIPITYIE
ncbi:MAG: DUF3365 domain-containing protein [Deferribacterales bacterium]